MLRHVRRNVHHGILFDRRLIGFTIVEMFSVDGFVL